MYSLNHELMEKLGIVNNSIKDKYHLVFEGDREKLRDFIGENVGTLEKIEALDKDDLAGLENKGGICGVDGSSNRAGGNYPHYIEVYQTLAMTTSRNDDPI